MPSLSLSLSVVPKGRGETYTQARAPPPRADTGFCGRRGRISGGMARRKVGSDTTISNVPLQHHQEQITHHQKRHKHNSQTDIIRRIRPLSHAHISPSHSIALPPPQLRASWCLVFCIKKRTCQNRAMAPSAPAWLTQPPGREGILALAYMRTTLGEWSWNWRYVLQYGAGL